ncbi:MAG: type IX secretion system protein PorQ [Saprospiraceae bacterium]|nr:type IX secretion system protein PorQ [Saprospiraceae bacterium]
MTNFHSHIRKLNISLALIFTPLSIALFLSTANAQIGGLSTFSFMKNSPSARISALAQSQIALKDDDLALGYTNAALLNPLMHKALTLNYEARLGGSNNSFVGGAFHVEKLKMTFSTGILYDNYGTFKQTDEFGNLQGEFKAHEYVWHIGAGRQLNERLSVGANLKFIGSQLEAYNAFGVAADLSGAYINPEKRVGVSVVLKNVGVQVKNYLPDGSRETLPYDLQIGVSKKLARAPFRFSVAAVDLLRWNMRYTNPLDNEVTLLGEQTTEPSSFSKGVDNLFRHIRFGGEIALGKTENFRARFGYNHQVRKEMGLQNIRSSAGFSFGAGLRVSKFRIDYAYAVQHLAGGRNHLTISTNLSALHK